MFDLTGKVVVVTGAARGMGRAIVQTLAHQKATVAATDILTDELEATVSELTQNNYQAAGWALDVSLASNVHQVFDEIINQFGQIDILVNNAGIFKPRSVADITEAEWDQMIDINLKGQFLCAQAAAQSMSQRQWGRIINIASVASGQVGVGVVGGTHYTASKGGVLGLTEALAAELAPQGITVNAISPGAIDTPMVAEAGFTDEAKAELLKNIPLGRMGRPEEIAYPVLFLASEAASYITGANLHVDGGWLAA